MRRFGKIKNEKWSESRLCYPICGRRRDAFYEETGLVTSLNGLWHRLVKWDSNKHIICAGTASGGGKSSSRGIIHGHAYSVLQVQEVAGFRLLQLRNPWHQGEWTGDWSDKSELWKKHAGE